MFTDARPRRQSSAYPYAGLVTKIFADDIFTQAAALGFYSILAVSPILVLLVTLLSALNLKWHEQLQTQVQDLMGAEAANAVEVVIRQSQTPHGAHVNLWSILILLISASAVFAQLQTSLSLIFATPKARKKVSSFRIQVVEFLTRRLICLGMVFTFVLISAASLIASGFLSLLAYGDLSVGMKILHEIGGFGVFAIFFALIFRWMPECRAQWRAAIHGGLLTAVLFTIGKVVIGIYLTRAEVGSAYGVAGSFIVLLVWVYYSVLIFLVGAELSALLGQRSSLSDEK